MLRLMLAMLAWLAITASAQAQGADRIALVVANEAYSGALTRLNRPHEDAVQIGGALQTAGFDVTSRHDQSRDGLLREVRALADRLRNAGPEAVGFFYYSGHGASARVGDRRRNYMIPVGTGIETPEDLVVEGVPLDDIIAILQRSNAKAIFIVFDACRSELPWSRGGTDPDKAFNAVSAGPDMFIAYSTAEGMSAPDDGAFAAALALQLVEPGLTHLEAFDAASRSVGRTRGVDRRPWYSNQIDEDVFFVPTGLRGQSAALPSPAATLPPSAPADVRAAVAAKAGRPVSERGFRDQLQDGTEGPEMVALPTGSFSMGSPVSEEGRDTNEGPMRTVTIGTQIAVMKYEVTVAEFRRFVEATGYALDRDCYADLDGDGAWAQTPEADWLNTGFTQQGAQPVVCVSRDDAKAYAAWLSQESGKPYRLLSEAEWEFAARAGTRTAFSFGEDGGQGCDYMNGADLTAKQRFRGWTTMRCADGYVYTSPVGSFRPNGFGLSDMHGNVWEWVEDCYEDSYLAGQRSDGLAYATSSCTHGVGRGGSWDGGADFLRSAIRTRLPIHSRSNGLGFRLARVV
ncbi:MAG: SUMF1/EgtB/PvdO family nonheme iron enzyme [Albidovulum sp.]